jgi:hypothetical protein
MAEIVPECKRSLPKQIAIAEFATAVRRYFAEDTGASPTLSKFVALGQEVFTSLRSWLEMTLSQTEPERLSSGLRTGLSLAWKGVRSDSGGINSENGGIKMSLTSAPETIVLFAEAGIGEVEQTITVRYRGRVKFAGSFWFARFYHSSHPEALPETAVRVVGRQGQTLLVVPMDQDWIPGQKPVAGMGEGSRSGWLGFLRQIGLALG